MSGDFDLRYDPPRGADRLSAYGHNIKDEAIATDACLQPLTTGLVCSVRAAPASHLWTAPSLFCLAGRITLG
ncbi:MAG: hypothetical protein QM661_08875 [Solimonas sp.]